MKPRRTQNERSAAATRHHAWIDCARGYAVLMVIACHTAYEFPGLPYPVKRVVVSGWFGVQLFFLASCLTLLASWHGELRRTGKVSLAAFFLRRLFRIAPAYYAAGALYYLVSPPELGFDPAAVLISAVFINAWFPASTTPSLWNVVPGGWSISVEFAFYAVFPLFTALVTTFPRAALMFCLTVVAGVAIDTVVLGPLLAAYPPASVGNFLFFWFPNQASVFALGAVLYFAMQSERWPRRFLSQHGAALGIGAILAFCALSYAPLGHYLGDRPALPAGLAVCLPLCLFLAALSGNPRLLTHDVAAFVGRISFSAYLLHFAALRLLATAPDVTHRNATGFAAIAAYAVGLGVAILMTCAAAWLAHRCIELPMINVGKRLIKAMPNLREPYPAGLPPMPFAEPPHGAGDRK